MLRIAQRIGLGAGEGSSVTPASSDSVVAGSLTGFIASACAGDTEAFAALLDLQLASALRVAAAILGNEADAQDAVQDAFIRAWRELPSLRDEARFDAWFARILINSCRMALRARSRRRVREITLPDLAWGQQASHSGPDAASEAVELQALAHAFERLSVEDRWLLVTRHHEDRSIREMAATLRIPEGTVKSRLHAARRALARALEEIP